MGGSIFFPMRFMIFVDGSMFTHVCLGHLLASWKMEVVIQYMEHMDWAYHIILVSMCVCLKMKHAQFQRITQRFA
jgi:hypothetical protein